WRILDGSLDAISRRSYGSAPRQRRRRPKPRPVKRSQTPSKGPPYANGTAAKLSEARRWLARGASVVPCLEKVPSVKGWNKRRLTAKQIDEILSGNPQLDIGVNWNSTDWIDVECDSTEAEKALKEMFAGTIPRTP